MKCADLKQYHKIYFTNFPIILPIMEIFNGLGFTPINANEKPCFQKEDIIFFPYVGPVFDTSDGWSQRLFYDALETGATTAIILVHVFHLLEERSLEEEVELFNKCDYLLVQTQDMKDYFETIGIKSKIINMEMFDFLSEYQNDEEYEFNSTEKIRNHLIYSGGIEDDWRHFFFKDFEHNFKIDFYGALTTKSPSDLISNSSYKGWHANDQLPRILKGDFGLIFMDKELHPHSKVDEFWRLGTSSKLPLYITSGLPIICKKGTGDQRIVEKYNIGFAVSCLKEIDDILNETSEEQYQLYKKNVEALMEKTKTGYFLKRAVNEVLSIFATEQSNAE